MELNQRHIGTGIRKWKNKRTLSHCSPLKECPLITERQEVTWKKYSSAIPNLHAQT